MGGRGKSSGAARAARLSGGLLNFGDPGAIPLERLEAKDARRVGPAEVAEGVEQVVEQLLTAPPALYAKHQAKLEKKMVELAEALKGRPVEEREAFSDALSPLLERLREHAEGRTS
tara:strand:+ start:26 stop:373 length:348 start_codon:yes stop_codon:yes gene_type:complete